MHSFNNKQYSSYKKLYKDNIDIAKVPYSTFKYRLNNGWSIQDALETPTNRNKFEPQIIEGVVYNRKLDIADTYHISNTTLTRRYTLGARNDELIKPTKRKIRKPHPASIPMLFEGKKYPSMNALAKAFNIHLATLQDRLNRGLSLNDALRINKRFDVNDDSIVLFKEQECTLTELSHLVDVPINSIKTKIRQTPHIGILQIDDIIDDLIRIKKEKERKNVNYLNTVVDGVLYKTYSDLANAYNLPHILVLQRIRSSGWTAEEAVKTPVNENNTIIKVDDLVFNSVKEAAAYFGFAYQKVSKRLNKGWSIKQALELEPRN